MRPSGARISDGMRGFEWTATARPLLIAGLGSPHVDDRLGWAVVDRLGPRLPASVTTSKVRGGLDLLDDLAGPAAALIVDASTPPAQPGRIRWFNWPCRELAEGLFLSTHGMGLVEALRMAEALDQSPRQVGIIAVEAQQVLPGASMSRIVARRVDVVVEVIQDAIRVLDHSGAGKPADSRLRKEEPRWRRFT
jgi:hydrogenase maturation protease